ncbi:MAG: thioester reductase domain-containing protein [Gemmatimonadetes bacterium]|nr:thioester reductase domain-containing protein [Gemmatimonadota bacterium]
MSGAAAGPGTLHPPARDPAAPAALALRARLAALIAAELGAPAVAIEADAPLERYGLDSLATVGIVAAVEEEFGAELPPSLLARGPTVETLARFLEGRPGGDPGEDPHAARARMLADAVLPDDVAPAAAGGGARPAAASPPASPFLTGATGFLGAYLLRTLLGETGARVHCLARAGDGDGIARIRRNLERYGIWEDAFAERIRVVDGDLAEPRLGLAPPAFAALAEEADAVYHAAAAVNWVYPYDALRAANVAGTLELLRLSGLARAKPFHFVSSMAVCYSTTGPGQVAEEDDMLPHLAGLHLGYAQSKCVAEALVRQAGARGLPVTIHRPALVAGDSRSGASNTDDIVSALLKGCIQMGCAPDLDWVMDSVPVEHAAEAIVRLSLSPGAAGRTFHLANPRARHWRECVLWMRLYGYPLQLLPYPEWLGRLERESAPDGHALRALRPFFLERHGAAGGLTLPELYEDGRRSRASCDASRRALAGAALRCPPLDAGLLDRYFAWLVGDGFLPRPPVAAAAPRPESRVPPLPALFEGVLRRRHNGAGVRLLAARPAPLGGDSIVAELTSWRSGRDTGLFRYALAYRSGTGADRRLDVVVKVKPADHEVVEVGEEVARLCDDAIGSAYARFRDRVGFAGGHLRELAVYAQEDERFRRHAPALLAAHRDDARRQWVLVLEHLSDVTLLDAADDASGWRRPHVEAALRGIAELHAVWYRRERELLAQPWLGHVHDAAGMAEMTPLWHALAEHARPIFAGWAGAGIGAVQARLIEGIARWWRPLEALPRTLIHNDFNPRNVALRDEGGTLRLCAYDWELATLGVPQHDLAEFLCFVLTPDARGEEVAHYVELHRRALERTAGTPIDPEAWRLGFRASLYDLLVNRFAMYALVERFRRQRFLPRVVRTWFALYALDPLEELE